MNERLPFGGYVRTRLYDLYERLKPSPKPHVHFHYHSGLRHSHEHRHDQAGYEHAHSARTDTVSFGYLEVREGPGKRGKG